MAKKGLNLKIRHKVNEFLKQEEGRISKHSVLTMGAMVGTAAVASVVVTKSAEAAVSAWLDPIDGSTVTLHGQYS